MSSIVPQVILTVNLNLNSEKSKNVSFELAQDKPLSKVANVTLNQSIITKTINSNYTKSANESVYDNNDVFHHHPNLWGHVSTPRATPQMLLLQNDKKGKNY